MADTWDMMVNVIKRTCLFPSQACGGTLRAPLQPTGTAELGGSSDFSSAQSGLCCVVRGEGHDSSPPAVNTDFPLDYEDLPRKTPMYAAGQVGLCTGNSAFALLLIP